MSKFSDWWVNLGSNVEIKIIQWIVYPVIFLLLCLPSIICFAIGGYSNDKYYALAMFSWIFPVCVVGLAFLSGIGWMIYNAVKDFQGAKAVDAANPNNKK